MKAQEHEGAGNLRGSPDSERSGRQWSKTTTAPATRAMYPAAEATGADSAGTRAGSPPAPMRAPTMSFGKEPDSESGRPQGSGTTMTPAAGGMPPAAAATNFGGSLVPGAAAAFCHCGGNRVLNGNPSEVESAMGFSGAPAVATSATPPAPLTRATGPPRFARFVLVDSIFKALDENGDALLSSAELQRFAKLAGFQGGADEWRDVFGRTCADRQCDPARGLDRALFRELLDDASYRGCLCDDAELRVILRRLAPPPAGDLRSSAAADGARGADPNVAAGRRPRLLMVAKDVIGQDGVWQPALNNFSGGRPVSGEATRSVCTARDDSLMRRCGGSGGRRRRRAEVARRGRDGRQHLGMCGGGDGSHRGVQASLSPGRGWWRKLVELWLPERGAGHRDLP